MKTNIFGWVVGLVLIVWTVGCSSPSQMDIETKMVSTTIIGTNTVQSTEFTHRDKSKIRGTRPGGWWGGNIVSGRVRIGGHVPIGEEYGYGAGGPGQGSYGYYPPNHGGGRYGY